MSQKQKYDRNDDHIARSNPEQDAPRVLGQSDDALLDEQHIQRTSLSPAMEFGEKYHEAGKRDVELYIRTYNTLLRSSGEINLNALIQAHFNIDSSLHPDARKP